MTTLTDFLQTRRQDNGVFVISEPRFFLHAEEAYDAQYGIDKLDIPAYRHEGSALLDLCLEFGYDSSWPALEIGCGTGRLSLSLMMSGKLGEILITDPSPAFCSITARKLASALPGAVGARIGILNADDLGLLPKESFSLIALRSVLHHILDIPRFFRECADLLIPGGLLIFEEPCYEGYVIMGAVTQFMADILECNGVALSEKHLADIQILADTMKFYARRDLDKSSCEDKHLFRTDELMQICDEYGMRLHSFPNRTFAEIHLRNAPIQPEYYERFYYDYLKYAMSWDQELVDLFKRHAKKYLEYFSALAPGGAMPYTHSSFLCKKK